MSVFLFITLPSCWRKEWSAPPDLLTTEKGRRLLALPHFCPTFYHISDDLENHGCFQSARVERRRLFSSRPEFKYLLSHIFT